MELQSREVDAVGAPLYIVKNSGVDQTYRFIAFLSYRRGPVGSPLASWLRSKLKNYKPPLELRDRLPPEVARDLFAPREVFLDTAFGRASEDFWNNNILPNLRASKFLVVVSTPEAFSLRSDGTQNWLVREIDAFLESGRAAGRIMIVLAPGAPEERFPGRLGDISRNWDWVELRSFSVVRWWRQSAAEERDEAIAKLVAGLYGLPANSLPVLRREERRRRGRTLRLAFATGLLLLFVISGLGVAAVWSAFEAEVSRREAVANENSHDRHALARGGPPAEPSECSETRLDGARFGRRAIGTGSLLRAVVAVFEHRRRGSVGRIE